MATTLFVRIKSDLEFKELERRVNERKPRFKEVPGLVQKFYGLDKSTGDVCGIYFFEDQKSLAGRIGKDISDAVENIKNFFGNLLFGSKIHYRDSELAKTIPTAYEATEVRKEVYEVLFPLYPDRGPVIE